MSLRSNDCKPTMSCRLATKNYLIFIPRNQISKYQQGQVIITVFYRIPVLGTRGNLIMDEQFDTVSREFTSYDMAQKFYKQKQASYKARKSARYKRLYDANIKYFAQIKRMYQPEK